MFGWLKKLLVGGASKTDKPTASAHQTAARQRPTKAEKRRAHRSKAKRNVGDSRRKQSNSRSLPVEPQGRAARELPQFLRKQSNSGTPPVEPTATTKPPSHPETVRPSTSKDELVVGQFMGRPVFDVRDQKERQIEQEALKGERLGAELDRLVAELIGIHETDIFTGGSNSRYNEDGHNVRAREIGKALDERGGMDLMRAAYYRVRATIPAQARGLEICWNGIGEWQS